ncbi:MAG TPA: hypothetical protein VK718_04025 [Ferruginibacter sp.]|jgi:hypothetical protein|nr:hypothetical protein [Ferruginibacter sp.]
MKDIKDINKYSVYAIAALLIFCVTGCIKEPRNYYADEDDPGLSRLTSHGYNVVTNYINGVPYVNPYAGYNYGNQIPTLSKITTSSTYDTLSLSWNVELNNTAADNAGYVYNSGNYNSISLLMPIPKNFSRTDLLSLNGQSFSSNTDAVWVNAYHDTPPYYDTTLTGVANIYFVSVYPSESSPSIVLSGLFNGNIGDSVLLTKGRFDFVIPVDNLNF